ncbi:MAG TPA: bifunctional phosphoribosylaminoimidazolecarboxamide formyltransferase/IMP cyclohydrolase [Vicinamibacterales bacterium]|nr:bifunctional phosphoribosylaminoimidazolecarboxamide formyltransferase/IMP cyclohydrolase [Vicinamibacterales bacterium]
MRALISVSDKTGLIPFATSLARLGWQLVSTGGTSKALAEAGLPVTGISDVTNFPEMMDGRVKTLHPAVHGGILARRHRPDDLEAIAAQGITPIDLVVVNLYPFQETAKKPGVAFDELIEHIDIGGPSMVRSAAKNFRDVLIVVSPGDYDRVLHQLARPDGPSLDFRYQLMRKAFMHTAFYDSAIAATFMRIDAPGAQHHHPEPKTLRYGENPHQKASWIERPDEGRWVVHQGKELSYTNLLDLDAALRIVLEFTEPAATVIKHTNPCGTATGAAIADVYIAARDADSLSAFGGIVGLNRAIDEACARALTSTFIEAVIAPGVDEAAKPILAAKANMRVVTADFAGARGGLYADTGESRAILGGILMQEADRVDEARERWPSGDSPKVVTKRAPTTDEWEAMRFAWRVCAHVKSNAVIFTARDRSLAVGAGQMSRVDAVNIAVAKASGTLAGSVAASDAFFPFRDGLDAVAAAGATAVVQPGGSKRDDEVIAAADEHGIAMVFTGRRHFRH